jgi:ketosteroid isomerase-like protein
LPWRRPVICTRGAHAKRRRSDTTARGHRDGGTKAGDIDTVLSLMAGDVVFLVAGQPPMIGKARFAAAQGPE